jgi:hypothetical protein
VKFLSIRTEDGARNSQKGVLTSFAWSPTDWPLPKCGLLKLILRTLGSSLRNHRGQKPYAIHWTFFAYKFRNNTDWSISQSKAAGRSKWNTSLISANKPCHPSQIKCNSVAGKHLSRSLSLRITPVNGAFSRTISLVRARTSE